MIDRIKIVDVINHNHAYGTQTCLVLNRMPNCLFEREGNWLIGSDDCVYRFYRYELVSHSWKAFGGTEFSIPMADGSSIKASGQWWDDVHRAFRADTYDHALNTVDGLAECMVFMGGYHVDRAVVDEWLTANDPSNNYYKYAPRDKDFGRHCIASRWDNCA